MRCTISPRCTDRDDVAQADDVFDLDRGEVRDGVVEAHLVALERLQGLVGAVEEVADLLELTLAASGVDVDDAHLLAGGDNGYVE